MNTEKLLRIDEVAERLAMKPSTIRAWILGRKLEVVRVGARAVRVREGEIQRILAEGTVPARRVDR